MSRELREGELWLNCLGNPSCGGQMLPQALLGAGGSRRTRFETKEVFLIHHCVSRHRSRLLQKILNPKSFLAAKEQL